MRIIAGRHRGRRLFTPQNRDIRPTSDRLRESLFNILSHNTTGPALTGARVMDVFAGTGALGLEALSRGASHVTFIEKSRQSLDLLKRNIALLNAQQDTQVIACSATALPFASAPVDMVFLDPPYRRNLAEPTLAALIEKGWLKAGTLVVLETACDETPSLPSSFEPVMMRAWGETAMRFMTYTP